MVFGTKILGLHKIPLPKRQTLYPAINPNTVKLSYSCTKSVKSIIQSQNKKVYTMPPNTIEKTYNCRVNKDCPLNNNCLQKSVIYIFWRGSIYRKYWRFKEEIYPTEKQFSECQLEKRHGPLKLDLGQKFKPKPDCIVEDINNSPPVQKRSTSLLFMFDRKTLHCQKYQKPKVHKQTNRYSNEFANKKRVICWVWCADTSLHPGDLTWESTSKQNVPLR